MTRRIVVLILAWVGAAVPVAGQARVGTVKEVLSLGAIDGPQELTFSQVVGIELASSGEIVVADRGESTIRVFSPTGDFVRVYGREGRGPAEFRSLAATAMLADTLFVLDRSLQKVAVFTLDGSLVRTRRVNYSPGQHGLIYRMYPLQSGDLVMESGSGCSLPRRPELDSQWWLLLLRPGEEELEPILKEDLGRSVPVYGTEDRFCTSFSFPFGPGPTVGVRPDSTVVFGTGETQRVSFFHLRLEDDSVVLGPPVANLDLPGGRRRIGRGERDDWLNRQVTPLSAEASLSKRASQVREVLEDVRFPEQWPAYDRLLFDAAGGVWVRRPPGLNAEQALWDAYSPEGRYRGRVELPAWLQVHRIRGDAVFGVVRDEWEVQYIKKYRINWRH